MLHRVLHADICISKKVAIGDKKSDNWSSRWRRPFPFRSATSPLSNLYLKTMARKIGPSPYLQKPLFFVANGHFFLICRYHLWVVAGNTIVAQMFSMWRCDAATPLWFAQHRNVVDLQNWISNLPCDFRNSNFADVNRRPESYLYTKFQLSSSKSKLIENFESIDFRVSTPISGTSTSIFNSVFVNVRRTIFKSSFSTLECTKKVRGSNVSK